MRMFEKLKGVKHVEWIVVLAAAALILFYFSSDSSTSAGADSDEQRLARVLSQIEGAGAVEVFLSYEEETQSVYAFSSQTSSPRVKGVIIVAEGAGDARVNLRLATAARTALGVDASCISVFAKK